MERLSPPGLEAGQLLLAILPGVGSLPLLLDDRLGIRLLLRQTLPARAVCARAGNPQGRRGVMIG